MTICSSL